MKFTRAGDTIFVLPPNCCLSSFVSMNMRENRKDDNLETYDFLRILWISFGASRFPVNNVCWIKEVIGVFTSVFIIKSL